MSNLYRGPSKDASYQVLIHLAKRFQRRRFLRNQQTWWPLAILVFDWSISKKSSSLKPLGQMNRNLVGSTYGRFCIKLSFLKAHRASSFLYITAVSQYITKGGQQLNI
jgi:hypothetical protein